jgi:hypothetical protein
MLMAAASAGQRGLTMRHIRVGALFWPAALYARRLWCGELYRQGQALPNHSGGPQGGMEPSEVNAAIREIAKNPLRKAPKPSEKQPKKSPPKSPTIKSRKETVGAQG